MNMKRKTEVCVKAVAFLQVAAATCVGLAETTSWTGGGGGGKRLGNKGKLERGRDP